MCVAIVWHPEPERIGMFAPLTAGNGDLFRISRHEPSFRTGNNLAQAPLADRHVSRQPLTIRRVAARTVEVTRPDSPMAVSVNGRLIDQTAAVSLDELGEDIIICLSDRIILSIFDAVLPLQTDAARHGLIGISKGLQRAWAMVRQGAPTQLPMLLTGATGTGKELVASAIHALSTRSAQKLHTVNMAALSASLAHAELFGATAGAYTGATAARPGLFAQAHGGTLFMDEIGDAPKEVQPMLLRALENGEYRRLGDTKVQVADVRIISATDRSLEAGDFNQPLRHRLQGVVVHLPPLRDRRVDIGLLLRHFLTRPETNLESRDPASVPAGQVLPLVLHPWPGNIRELAGAARQMRMGVPVTLKPVTTRAVSEMPLGSSPVAPPPPGRRHRDPATVDDAEMVGALAATEWNIKAAATLLNVSRTSLYRLMERSPSLKETGMSSAGQGKDDTHRRTDDGHSAWADNLKRSGDRLRRHFRRSDMQ